MKRQIFVKSFHWFVLPMALALVAACGRSSVSQKPTVVVGIMPVYELAQAIAGDSVNVVCLMPRGGNPETYEPTMSQFVEVEKSEAFMYVNETGFESAIMNRINEAGNGKTKVANLSEGIAFLYGTHGDCPHHHHSGCSHESDDADPHVWSSARNAGIIAHNILTLLCEVSPGDSLYFRNNYDILKAEIDSVDNELRQVLLPHRGAAFVVWHPSLGYFARDYGLEQISVGGQENKETSVGQLQDRIEKATGRGVKVMVLQQNYDNRQAQVVNDQIGARMVTIDPLSADWALQLKKVAYAIASEGND